VHVAAEGDIPARGSQDFIRRAVELAGGRHLIFKLNPNENIERATREIHRHAPGAMVFTTGSAEKMIANCDVLITRFSSTAFVGLALGRETYSDFDMDELRRLMPVQNGSAAFSIANVCRRLLDAAPLQPRVPAAPAPGIPVVRLLRDAAR
jgi:hypothetical protein